MKKKLLFILLSACFALGLCGCGGAGTDEAKLTADCQNGNFVGEVDRQMSLPLKEFHMLNHLREI